RRSYRSRRKVSFLVEFIPVPHQVVVQYAVQHALLFRREIPAPLVVLAMKHRRADRSLEARQPRQIAELRRLAEARHWIVANVLVPQLQQCGSRTRALRRLHRVHQDLPLYSGQRHERQIVPSPLFVLLRHERTVSPMVRPTPSVPPFYFEKRRGDGTAVSQNVNESRFRKNTMQKIESRPPGDLHHKLRSPARELFAERVDDSRWHVHRQILSHEITNGLAE